MLLFKKRSLRILWRFKYYSMFGALIKWLFRIFLFCKDPVAVKVIYCALKKFWEGNSINLLYNYMLLLLGEAPVSDFTTFIPKLSLFLTAFRLKLLMSETYISIHIPKIKVKRRRGDEIHCLIKCQKNVSWYYSYIFFKKQMPNHF